MSNIYKKSRNQVCTNCGRDSQSHKIGSFITTHTRAILQMDQQVDALTVYIPLQRSLDKPKNFARLTYNPFN